MPSSTPETAPSFILKNDPSFHKNGNDHFNFAELRQIGLKHIQDLSGKIWTDHNTHDPGITTLEVLIYALMDLGYRARLPIEDLLTQQTATEPSSRDDNFFTPAEILTVNPLTITDYRKLLMELPGIRNAWLEMNREPISLNDCLLVDKDKQTVVLNGLYRIILEKEPDNAPDDNTLTHSVLRRMAQYRNLGEDVQPGSITLLKPTEITVTIELEVEKSANLDEVYARLVEELKAYFSPTVPYYTLSALLEQKLPQKAPVPIEEAFAGRPYTTESKGFIDTRELEKLKRRREIHVSDLYTVAQGVKGVVSVRELEASDGGNTDPWVIKLSEEKVAKLAALTVQFYKEGIKQAFQIPDIDGKKKKGEALLTGDALDYAVPTGQFRQDLGDYYSIQNDFPSVYGIGNEELPASVGVIRQVQANQLKGYLFFYDQLLAGYLSQLTQLRELFSLRPDSQRQLNQQHVLFGKPIDAVPHWQELIRFQTNQPLNRGIGTPFVWPIRKTNELTTALQNQDWLRQQLFWKQASANLLVYSRTLHRDFAVQQVQNDLRQGRFRIDYYEDKSGWFFIMTPESLNGLVLISTQTYPTYQKARSDAEAVDVFGSQPQNSRSINHYDQNTYTFELLYNPVDYVAYLQDLLENETRYLTRRSAFLDHLLARFAESFTDFSLLAYQQVAQSQKQVNETKGLFLSQYDELSRNRGKAYNYLRGFWNTNNRSGLEKRVLTQAGVPNLMAHSLGHFEVVQRPDAYTIELQDDQGKNILKSPDPYETENDAQQGFTLLQKALAQLTAYQPVQNKDKDKYLFQVITDENDVLISTRSFDTPTERDAHLRAVQRLYSPEPTSENIIPAYALQLYDAQQNLFDQKTSLYSPDIEQAISEFIESLQDRLDLDVHPDSVGNDTSRLYLNKRPFTPDLPPLVWQWSVNNTADKQAYVSDKEAIGALASVLEAGQFPDVFQELFPIQQEGFRWRLSLEGNPVLESQAIFRDKDALKADYRRLAQLLKKPDRFTVIDLGGNEFLLEFRNRQDRLVATSPRLQGDANGLINQIVTAAQRTFEPITVEEPYSFKMARQTEKGEVVYLQSYNYYSQLTDAIDDYIWTLKQAKLPKGTKRSEVYIHQGDPESSQYSFILQDNDKRLLADYPGEFDDEAERDKFLQETVNWFKRYVAPIQLYTLKAPVGYTYRWHPIDAISFQSVRNYATEQEARSDFYHTLHFAANERLFTDQLELIVDKEVRATIVYTRQSKPVPDPATLIHNVSTPIQQQQYRLERVFLNDFWRFHYYLPDGVSWYESTDELTSESQVQEAYHQFVLALGKLQLVRLEGTDELVVKQSDGKQVAQLHTPNVPDIDQQQHFLDYKDLLFAKPYADVVLTSHPEEWLYRVVRNDKPLAYHPQKIEYTDEDPDEDEVKDARKHEATQKRKYLFDRWNWPKAPLQWLQICLSGDHVLERTYRSTKVYHYVIRRQEDHQILFISYARFPTSEAADEACQQNYLALLTLASDKANYARYDATDGFVRLYGNSLTAMPNQVISIDEVYDYEIENPLPPGSPIPIAVIPKSGALGRSDIFAELDKLVTLVVSYPIRQYADGSQFKFQLYDQQEKAVLWRSVSFYSSADEAMSAFLQFLPVLKNRDNYMAPLIIEALRAQKTTGEKVPRKYQLRLLIREIVLESLGTYDYQKKKWKDFGSEQEAWVALQEMIGGSHDAQAFVLEPDGNNYSFSVVSPSEYYTVRHPFLFETQEACQQAINQLHELAKDNKLESFVRQAKQPTRWMYQFTLTPGKPTETKSGSGRIVWQSFHTYETEALAQNALDDVLDPDRNYEPKHPINPKHTLLQSIDNYACFPTEDGRYEIRIVNKELGRKAKHPVTYATRIATHQAIQRTQSCLNDDGMHLLEHLLLIPHAPVASLKVSDDCVVCWTDEPEPNDPCSRPVIRPYIPCADPYSFWATIVLPNWTQRFSEQSIREAFEKVLRRQSPAHIGLKIYWATPQAMCSFEKAYYAWLKAFRRYKLYSCTEEQPQTIPCPAEASYALIKSLSDLPRV
ncbi:hypothetical protein [Spirosoma panaciterrae]|uniref:hypothetical protein n=1 Tax=Spirosoma panaciterrae TaxID=496058 RepID=UPI00036B286E|nr:hypothetical protein [Spirosoma panaciterrae]